MGSSSGLYFTHLIQANSPPTETPRVQQPRPLGHSSGMRQAKPDYSSVYRALASLPQEDDAHHLFDLYFRYIHPDHPVLHVQSVWSALQSLYTLQKSATNASTDFNGWPMDTTPFAYNGEMSQSDSQSSTPITIQTAGFHVFMVFALAASVRVTDAPMEFAPAQYYRLAISLSKDVLERTTISNLQAVYLLAIYALMSPAKLNIWTLTHLCMAHSIDLGIHRQPTENSRTARVTRALLFHSIYSLDRSVAVIQGRPLGIRDETFEIKLPSADDVKAEAEGTNVPAELATFVGANAAYSLHRLRLDKVISKIKLVLYHLRTDNHINVEPVDHHAQQREIEAQLDEWQLEIQSVTSQLQLEESQRRRLQLHLEVLYHSAKVLLYQPSQVFRRPDDNQLMTCYGAATQQISCYKSLYEDDMLQLDWRTIRSIFACGATIIYCFWTSKNLQSSAHRNQMAGILQSCITFLTIGGVWWPSVKKGKASFERLVHLTIQQADSTATDEDQQRRKRRTVERRNRNPQRQESYGQPAERTLQPAPLQTMQQTAAPEVTMHNQYLASNDSHSSGRAHIQNQQYPFFEHAGPDFGGAAADNTGYVHQSEFEQQLDPTLSYDTGAFNPAAGTYMEPEIEAFLGDFFLDDGTWNMSDGGPPLAFHFGNL